jgi:hypothetical protein
MDFQTEYGGLAIIIALEILSVRVELMMKASILLYQLNINHIFPDGVSERRLRFGSFDCHRFHIHFRPIYDEEKASIHYTNSKRHSGSNQKQFLMMYRLSNDYAYLIEFQKRSLPHAHMLS